MVARIIALGQEAAGDDGAGPAVLAELRRRGVPPEVELVRAGDALALTTLLETPARVILLDAAVGAAPGQVLELGVDDLAARRVTPISSHGLGIPEVIELMRRLAPDRISPSIRIVAIAILRPRHPHEGLSPEVAAAVVPAADRVLKLAAPKPEPFSEP